MTAHRRRSPTHAKTKGRIADEVGNLFCAGINNVLSFAKTRSACILNEFLKPPAARTDDVILRLRGGRPPTLLSREPRPEEFEPFSMPADDSLRHENHQGRTPLAPDFGKPNPEEAIRWTPVVVADGGAGKWPVVGGGRDSLGPGRDEV